MKERDPNYKGQRKREQIKVPSNCEIKKIRQEDEKKKRDMETEKIQNKILIQKN